MSVNFEFVCLDTTWDGPGGQDRTLHVIREILPLVLRKYGIDSPCEPAAVETEPGLECSS